MIKTKDISKYKNFLFQIFLIGIIVFTGVNFFRPKLREVFQLRKKINEEKEVLAKLTQKEAFLENLDEQELTTKAQFLLKVLPPEKDVTIPLATLKSLVSQFNLQLQKIQIDLGGKTTSGLSSVGFSLEVEGEKEKIIDFIEKVKTTYPLMRMEGVNFSYGDEDLLNIKLKIETFFLEMPKEIGKLESPLPLINSEEEKIYKEVSQFSSPLSEEAINTIYPTGKENPFAI